MIYEKLKTNNWPEKDGWYNTNKGELYWFTEEGKWSSRDDRVSIEYPMYWYKDITDKVSAMQDKIDEYEQLCEGFKVVDLIRATKKHSSFSLIIQNLTQQLSVDYWKKRCLLAEIIVVSSPCDPDISKEQIQAHENYKEFMQKNQQP